MAQSNNGIQPKNVIIMGAAGRDFHNFNVYYRTNPLYRVVAFTAAQIPDIDGRRYPTALAGDRYPDGIPIAAESELPRLIREKSVDEVVFAYSDLSHEDVMHRASIALANGADFRLLGPNSTMMSADVPVVAVAAVRTGAGKSQTTRKIAEYLTRAGLRVVVIRHPMPYGDLAAQAVQRFASREDMELHRCTIEEREEYEPHVDRGNIVYAGVDYGRILKKAQAEADVLLWDGGNNDFPFYTPDLLVTIVDPHRPGHETAYHPGETNLRMADVIVINKVDTATSDQVRSVKAAISGTNPEADVVLAASPITVDDPESIRGKRVVVVEDGPTLTHGGMAYGAGSLAAETAGATLVDPRPYAVGSLKETLERHRHLGNVVPAMGYGDDQMRELQETINRIPADAVVIGTPIDLARLLDLDKPATRVHYEFEQLEGTDFEQILRDRILSKTS